MFSCFPTLVEESPPRSPGMIEFNKHRHLHHVGVLLLYSAGRDGGHKTSVLVASLRGIDRASLLLNQII
jgi:hypothetical protein